MVNPVLEDALWIEENAEHAKVSEKGVKEAAEHVAKRLSEKPFTQSSWSSAPLHPDLKKHTPKFIANWIFLVSALNFSFWSDNLIGGNQKKQQQQGKSTEDAENKGDRTDTAVEPFSVGLINEDCSEVKVWKGYWSLLAALWRGLSGGYDIVEPSYYANASIEDLKIIFKSDTPEPFPLLETRFKVIWETGKILCEKYDGNAENVIKKANSSAMELVRIVTEDFPSFRDTADYNGREVRLWKRAQILVAETWAAFNGENLGQFSDIGELTMFADYRVPQNLLSLGSVEYSKKLTDILWSGKVIENGCVEEVELRAASIVAVERIKQILKDKHNVKIDAIVLDFVLWDWAKERQNDLVVPHHLTRSCYY